MSCRALHGLNFYTVLFVPLWKNLPRNTGQDHVVLCEGIGEVSLVQWNCNYLTSFPSKSVSLEDHPNDQSHNLEKFTGQSQTQLLSSLEMSSEELKASIWTLIPASTTWFSQLMWKARGGGTCWNHSTHRSSRLDSAAASSSRHQPRTHSVAQTNLKLKILLPQLLKNQN